MQVQRRRKTLQKSDPSTNASTRLFKIFGKPRPHLIALCKPDLANIDQYIVGPATGRNLSPEWTLVDASICLQTDKKMLNDGFRSFPSGHCSFSWSGLLYLSLFLASKFAIAIPYLPLRSSIPTEQQEQRASTDTEMLPLRYPPASGSGSAHGKSPMQLQSEGLSENAPPIFHSNAAAPLYLVVLAAIPLG